MDENKTEVQEELAVKKKSFIDKLQDKTNGAIASISGAMTEERISQLKVKGVELQAAAKKGLVLAKGSLNEDRIAQAKSTINSFKESAISKKALGLFKKGAGKNSK